jgi:hypothetical protein
MSAKRPKSEASDSADALRVARPAVAAATSAARTDTAGPQGARPPAPVAPSLAAAASGSISSARWEAGAVQRNTLALFSELSSKQTAVKRYTEVALTWAELPTEWLVAEPDDALVCYVCTNVVFNSIRPTLKNAVSRTEQPQLTV